MKASELRSKSAAELKEQLVALKKELFNLRFQQASGELQNTARFSQVRRDVARVNTMLQEKQNAKAA